MLSFILELMACIRLMLVHVVLGGCLEGALLPIWQLKATHYLLWKSTGGPAFPILSLVSLTIFQIKKYLMPLLATVPRQNHLAAPVTV